MNLEDLKKIKTNGFSLYRGNEKRILIQGVDAWDFLNRISTVKVSKEKINQVLAGALLNGRSEVIAPFHAWVKESEVELILSSAFYDIALKHLDSLHFGEKITLGSWDDLFFIEVRGGNSPFLNQKIVTEENIGGKRVLILPLDNWGLPGFLWGATHTEDILGALKMLNLKQIDRAEYDLICSFYGQASTFNLVRLAPILELGWDRFIDREKGCYPGQEVIEKVYTYGRVAKKTVSIVCDSKLSPKEFESFESSTIKPVFVGDERVGIFDVLHRLDDGTVFGLINILAAHAVEGKKVLLSDKKLQAQIKTLT